MKPLNTRSRAILFGGLFSLVATSVSLAVAADVGAEPDGLVDTANIEPRPPWTTSRITGILDPPPYQTEPVFPHLQFVKPVVLTKASGSSRWFVAELAGRIFSFPDDPDCRQPDLFVDLAEHIEGVQHIYGMAFHPEFKRNGYVYICYLAGKGFSGDARVSRFKVSGSSPPRCDPDSERLLIEWATGGHNGGCIKFGPDGYLYISTGDGASPSPPDPHAAGQNLADLRSSILRIDVDQTDEGLSYRIPPDNPFVDHAGARAEIWAYGLRNPWKMNFDRVTGDLWLGDVGWESWEMVHRIERGGNYGWSIMEGPLPILPDSPRGPTPISPPTVALPRAQAASVTGGFVYRGEQFPELHGAYIFGDYVTRKVWATRVQSEQEVSTEELATTDLQLITFGEDERQELYLVDYEHGTIHQLIRRAADPQSEEFPKKLSQTGLFASVSEHTPQAGVVPFSINAGQWADHATAQRWVALPNDSTVGMRLTAARGTLLQQQLEFPENTVLLRTLSLEMQRDNPASQRRIETQILHRYAGDWRGYSYRWNAEQTDATLVAADGEQIQLSIDDPQAPGGQRDQTWSFVGRAQCTRCHNAGAGHTLAFNLSQLDRPNDAGSSPANQLQTLQQMGVLTPVAKPAESKTSSNEIKHQLPVRRLVDPYSSAYDLDQRVRSYLHVNCSHCHQATVGGNSDIDLRAELPLERTKMLAAQPLQGAFGLADARIVSPQDPYSSVLMYRLAKTGRGRMPRGSELVDREGLDLLYRWIAAFSGDVVRIDSESLPDLTAEHSSGEIEKLLASTNGALKLQRQLLSEQLPESVRQEVIAVGGQHENESIRDLFEHFLRPEERVERQHQSVQPSEILAVQGDPERGKELFFHTEAVQCKACHRIGERGSTLGPDLSTIGRQRDAEHLLQSILEPSREIEPRYLTWVLQTVDGQVFSGFLEGKTDKLVVLRDTQGREIRIDAERVDVLQPLQVSLMPELLLQDMTAAEIADLLAYLRSLR